MGPGPSAQSGVYASLGGCTPTTLGIPPCIPPWVHPGYTPCLPVLPVLHGTVAAHSDGALGSERRIRLGSVPFPRSGAEKCLPFYVRARRIVPRSGRGTDNDRIANGESKAQGALRRPRAQGGPALQDTLARVRAREGNAGAGCV